jgi:hypothetical protein
MATVDSPFFGSKHTMVLQGTLGGRHITWRKGSGTRYLSKSSQTGSSFGLLAMLAWRPEEGVRQAAVVSGVLEWMSSRSSAHQAMYERRRGIKHFLQPGGMAGVGLH